MNYQRFTRRLLMLLAASALLSSGWAGRRNAAGLPGNGDLGPTLGGANYGIGNGLPMSPRVCSSTLAAASNS